MKDPLRVGRFDPPFSSPQEPHCRDEVGTLRLGAAGDATLSRRSQHLRRRLRPVPPGEGLHLVLDSMGLSIVGAGEQAAATHGGRGRRGWRKVNYRRWSSRPEPR